MTRRPPPGSPGVGARPMARRVARRVANRVVGTVLAASAGALAMTMAVDTLTQEPLVRVEGADVTARTVDRPSRAQARAAAPPGGIVQHLLPASAWPTPSRDLLWHEQHTELHEPRTLAGSCHRFPLVSVGAVRVAHRAYLLGKPTSPHARAEHVVARFADPRTAWRAHEVLLAWREGCRETLTEAAGLRVSPLRELDEGAQRYAVAWYEADGRLREDVALARVGNRVTLLRLTSRPTSDGAVDAAGGGSGARVVAGAVAAAVTLLAP